MTDKPDISAGNVRAAVAALLYPEGGDVYVKRSGLEQIAALLEAQQAEIERLQALELERSRLLDQIAQQGQECDRS